MQQISEKIVASLPAPAGGNRVHYFSGAALSKKKAPSGFGVRVTSNNVKAFVLFHRVNGRKHLETLGQWSGNANGGSLSVLAAVALAEKTIRAIKSGKREDPRPARTQRQDGAAEPKCLTVADVLDEFVQRYVRTEAKLRSADEIAAGFERLVKPAIGKIGIAHLKRSDVVRMLDDVADTSGLRMADLTLAHLRKALRWYAARDDQFVPPIVPGMQRWKPKEHQRERILCDDEIRDLWTALGQDLDAPACFPVLVKVILLTATRRGEAAGLHQRELECDSTWTIPASRYKGKHNHTIPLSAAAQALIGPRAAIVGYLFSSDGGKRAFDGFSKSKRSLDHAIAEIRQRAGRAPMEPWTYHDLRRTARSLMSRAGVLPDHAERALGHAITGIRATYDRHEWFQEKLSAFEALAATVTEILADHL